MVRIIPEEKIRYEPHEISFKSIDSVLRDLKKLEKKVGNGNKSNPNKFQRDIAKIRINLIGAIKPN